MDAQIEALISEIEREVDLKIYSEREDPDLKKFLNLLEEAKSEKIKYEIFEKEEEITGLKPVLKIEDKIFYLGFPKGNEIRTFFETLVYLSKGESKLSDFGKKVCNKVENLWLTVFITPFCPYCPIMALLSNRIAVESKGRIKSVIVDALKFFNIATRFNVRSVPTTFISKEFLLKAGKYDYIIGAVPEEIIMEKIVRFYFEI